MSSEWELRPKRYMSHICYVVITLQNRYKIFTYRVCHVIPCTSNRRLLLLHVPALHYTCLLTVFVIDKLCQLYK